MAILTLEELAFLRRETAKHQTPVTWTKPQINAASQATENWFEANRASLNSAINAATSPVVFPAAVKLRLVKEWLRQKFERGG